MKWHDQHLLQSWECTNFSDELIIEPSMIRVLHSVSEIFIATNNWVAALNDQGCETERNTLKRDSF